VKEWVEKVKLSTGAVDAKNIKYVVSDDTIIPPKIAEYFSKQKIDVIKLPHL